MSPYLLLICKVHSDQGDFKRRIVSKTLLLMMCWCIIWWWTADDKRSRKNEKTIRALRVKWRKCVSAELRTSSLLPSQLVAIFFSPSAPEVGSCSLSTVSWHVRKHRRGRSYCLIIAKVVVCSAVKNSANCQLANEKVVVHGGNSMHSQGLPSCLHYVSPLSVCLTA